MSYSHDLAKTKLDRTKGVLTREIYWEEIQTVIRLTDGLRSIISDRLKNLSIAQEGLVLEYALHMGQTISMYLDPEDIRTAPFVILAEGDYEPFECQLLLEVVRKSKIFCDVGSNIGFYTLAALATNNEIQVISFEPNTEIAKKQIKNLAINKHGKAQSSNTRFTIHEVALGAQADGVQSFYIPAFTGSGGGSLKNLHPEEGLPKVIQIPITTLDVVLDGRNVDLIKIDVEGFEQSVILGASVTIKSYKPTIFVELLRKWMKPFGKHPQDVLDELFRLGYICFSIGEKSLQLCSEVREDTLETNFIFCHPDRNDDMDMFLQYLRKD